ncbi:MAG: hypothetical protein U0414_41085 [Polyangiaceae bacterium]
MNGTLFATSRARRWGSNRRGVNVVELVVAAGLVSLVVLVILGLAR